MAAPRGEWTSAADGAPVDLGIAHCCTDSLARLTGDDHKAVKTTTVDEVYTTRRLLLFVTRARVPDHLLVTGVEPTQEFLDDR
jgi:hypothetical protein